jgi:hypothetical protein
VATLQYVVNAVDNATATFERIAGSADDLVTQIEELGRSSATARVGLAGDREAVLSLDNLELKLARLSRRVTSPKVTVEGLASASLGITALELQLGRLNAKHATAGGQGILSLLSGAFSGGGAAGKAGGGLIPGFGALPPQLQAGAGVAALAALPFLAQAAATGIVTVLGGAMVGLGVYAELGVKSVQKQWKGLVTGPGGIEDTLRGISPAFGQALTTILSGARTFIPQFIRAFGPALDAISKPLASLGVMIEGTLASPQVAASISAVGKAFGSILTALTPTIPGDINAIADGIKRVADSILAHPQLLAGFLTGLSRIAAGALDVIAALSDVAGWIESNWKWDKWFIIPEITAITWVVTHFGQMRHDVAGVFDGLRHDVAHIWDVTWQNTVGRVTRGVTDVMLGIGSLPGKIAGVFRGAITWLYGFGKDILQGLINGARFLWNTITGFFTGLGSAILGAVKGILGIHSPSSAFHGVGVAIMQGLLAGLKSEAGHVLSWMEGLASSALSRMTGASGFSPGSGLSSSAAQNMVVMQQLALKRGWSGDQWQALYNVEMAEAGFSLTAKNPGSGAYGEAQFINGPSEYYTWGGNPFTAAGQATAMLNYIASRYGTPAAAWAHEQAFHWYGSGLSGIFSSPTLIGVGESGPERVSVTPLGGGGGRSRQVDELIGAVRENTDVLAGCLDQLTAVTASAPATTGATLGAALSGAARRSTYRALYR